MKKTLLPIAIPLALVTAAALVQAWVIARAITPAQDAVRYVATAQAIERDGVSAVVRRDPEPPLFSCVVAGLHAALTAAGWVRGRDWALCAQLAAAIPLVLAAPLVYGLARRVAGRRSAFIAALAFAFLPSIARLGADGLGDSMHLFWYLASAWCAARYFSAPRAVRPDRPWALGLEHAWLVAAGALAGIALWARGEAIVLMPAAALAAGWATRGKFLVRSCRATLAAGALAAGALLTLAPYLHATDAWHPRAAIARLVGGQRADEQSALNEVGRASDRAIENAPAPSALPSKLPDGRAMSFARKDPSHRIRRTGLAAIVDVGREAVGSLHGVGLVFLAWGWRRGRERRAALRAWFAFVSLLHCGGAFYLGATRGYVSDRHFVPWAATSLPWVAAGAIEVGVMALRKWREFGSASRQSPPRWRGVGTACACGLLLVVCIPALSTPLHGARLGHRLAADWMREHAAESQAVLDTRGWTALYSGRTTYRYELARTAFADPRLAYLVLEADELTASSLRGESLRHVVRESAEWVGDFPSDGPAAAQVVVFRWRPNRFALARGN